MIDLHCHILPALDDGPKDIDEALAMADTAAKDGVQTLVATPHVNAVFNSPSLITEKIEELNKLIKKKQIPVTVLKGAEIASSYLKEDLKSFTIHSSSYILIEFPLNYLPFTIKEDLFLLQRQGLRPIIAHPERNEAIIEKPDLLLNVLSPGILVQISAGSITGEFGPTVRELAIHLLIKGVVHCIASDCHSNINRKPGLTNAVKKAAKIVGKEKAKAMVTDNPQLILQNRSI